ncbi:MAG: dienelactone hydrolase family protein [Myxococcales bacterium]|nr:dienelactone hydrolase family protein [Myxococcales bacterium]
MIPRPDATPDLATTPLWARKHGTLALIWLLVGVSLVTAHGCGSDDAAPETETPRVAADFGKPGRFAVGTMTYALVDQARGRTLNVEVVYPVAASSAAAAGALDMASFCTSTADKEAMAQLLAKAPTDCPTRSTDVVVGGAIAKGKFPVVVFSHCHDCTRWSSLGLLKRLASHGVVVLAPDHAGNTLFDKLAGNSINLFGQGKTFVGLRVGDLKAVLDDAEAGSALPKALADHLDFSRVGAMGHSFGSVTAGLFSQTDPRVKAAIGVAAPMQNPLLPGVDMAKLKMPVLLFLAEEDNSIGTIGNQFLTDNFEATVGPAWLVSVADAGHWSFSDVAGLHEMFDPGCGKAKRMTDGTEFSYLPVSEAQHIASSWASAFFAAHLEGDAGAIDFLAEKPGDSRVTVTRRPAP